MSVSHVPQIVPIDGEDYTVTVIDPSVLGPLPAVHTGRRTIKIPDDAYAVEKLLDALRFIDRETKRARRRPRKLRLHALDIAGRRYLVTQTHRPLYNDAGVLTNCLHFAGPPRLIIISSRVDPMERCCLVASCVSEAWRLWTNKGPAGHR